MYIIVGLGNPGNMYKETRHNIGFEAIDAIANTYQIKMDTKKHKAICGTGTIRGNKVLLVKPQTYMNLSGESVRQILDFYKLTNESLMIIYDDTTLPVGQLRIRTKGSAGGHNGIKSIIGHLGSDVFNRIKVGIDEKPSGWDLADYVLGKFTKEQGIILRDTLPTVVDAATEILVEGVEKSMNKFNVKR